MNVSTILNVSAILSQTERMRVSDGAIAPVLSGCEGVERLLVLVWPQLGDFDSLEYAWWLRRDADLLRSAGVAVRAIAIGDRAAGRQFCEYTGFDTEALFVDPDAALHDRLGLYSGLNLDLPRVSKSLQGYISLLLMCAGMGSPGTLKEVLRGYWGDRLAPQLIADEESVKAAPLPTLKGSFFKLAGGTGFQRPFELATLRLRNMAEVLGHWQTYVTDAAYLPQRGATFVFELNGDGALGELLYEHRDRGLLGFAANPSNPLSFIGALPQRQTPLV